jgi:hypothetical protein
LAEIDQGLKMNNLYSDPQWWLNEIEHRCRNQKKSSEEYRRANRRLTALFASSLIASVSGVGAGICADFQTHTVVRSIAESVETLAMFIASLLAGFTIDEWRNRAAILENATLLRPSVFHSLIDEVAKDRRLEPSKIENCYKLVRNGEGQMSKGGDDGLSALKAVIQNVIEKINA